MPFVVLVVEVTFIFRIVDDIVLLLGGVDAGVSDRLALLRAAAVVDNVCSGSSVIEVLLVGLLACSAVILPLKRSISAVDWPIIYRHWGSFPSSISSFENSSVRSWSPPMRLRPIEGDDICARLEFYTHDDKKRNIITTS